MSPADLVPRPLCVFFAVVRAAPWTDLRTLNGLVLLNGTALFLVAAAVFRLELVEWLVNSWLIFLGALLGVSVAGHIGKRATYRPEADPERAADDGAVG